MKTDLVEVRPLKPFVGSYACALADADMIDDILIETPQGIVKAKQPKRRFTGLIPVTRQATADELAISRAGGTLPPHIELAADSRAEWERRATSKGQAQSTSVVEHPKQRSVSVPSDVATNLIERGLAEAVVQPRPARTAR